MSVALTHGAKKNVGDYLIHSRARKLWKHLAPEVDLFSVPRWEAAALPLDAQSLILCGGPGFTPRMVEGVFPIVKTALERDIPISGLALGWQGLPKRNPGSFAMTARSVATLRSIANSGAPISVRDDVTQDIARQFGIDTIRTGCSAWYSIPDLGRTPLPTSESPQTIVYTTPAQPSNTRESIAIMRALRRKFRGARLIASFHRGIRPDVQTTKKQSAPLIAQAAAARVLGFEVRDVSYDLSKIDFYRESDLHIGYRVHAHLDYVSRRMPSILISEDGRGFGQTETLHGKNHVLWAGSKNLLERLDRRLTTEISGGWPSLAHAVDVIENSYPVMREVILTQAILGSRA
ncbi:polysaccharide pyruvyl transferase family protein [Leucobacter coleopterorum]|uniref:Polysaccharide pyruvyl transferase family protein n=1 Tax=Leucobacter coleopterorum TaxID=2714933 RepID=A0ABX6JYC4_9MICO|nr:polysaccharide pyruvyl transferase family protein [Leucobacter coleopterorum]QIM19318.1 polysaccharide pyruvyl transferase family protein [Leucobacter coleopterorum]